MATKCCKERKCAPEQNKCNTTPFYNSEMYYKIFYVINFLIICYRIYYLKKDEYKQLTGVWQWVTFIAWLELQILFFFIVFQMFMILIYNVIYLIEILQQGFTILFKNNKPKGLFKTFKQDLLYNILLKIAWTLIIIGVILAIIVLISLFILFIIICGPLLLGYTSIYSNT
jgi:hypothetical protein